MGRVADLAAQVRGHEAARDAYEAAIDHLKGERLDLALALEGALNELRDHIRSEYQGTGSLGPMLARLKPWEDLLVRVWGPNALLPTQEVPPPASSEGA